MEVPRSNRFTPVMKVKEICGKMLGIPSTDKLTGKGGKIVHSAVGFDSPLLMLSPVKYLQTPEPKEDLAKNKLVAGVEFHLGINGSGNLDGFLTQVRAKGITVINEPHPPQ